MNDDNDVKISLKPPRFSGVKSEWEYFKIAMKAYQSVSGLGDIVRSMVKQFSLYGSIVWFGHVVCNHVVGWTVLGLHFTSMDLYLNSRISILATDFTVQVYNSVPRLVDNSSLTFP